MSEREERGMDSLAAKLPFLFPRPLPQGVLLDRSD